MRGRLLAASCAVLWSVRMPRCVRVSQDARAFPSAACRTSSVKQSQRALCSAVHREQHVAAAALSTYLQEWIL